MLNNPHVDPWEIGNASFGRLTHGLKAVLIAVDWTQVGDFMSLEALWWWKAGGIPFFSLSVPKGELKGRQRTLELSMEYALAAPCGGWNKPYIRWWIVDLRRWISRPFGALSLEASGDASESHDDLALG